MDELRRLRTLPALPDCQALLFAQRQDVGPVGFVVQPCDQMSKLTLVQYFSGDIIGFTGTAGDAAHSDVVELDGFVDVLARRIASFDRRPIAAAKKLINDVSLPSADRLLDGLTSFTTALTWPEAQQRFQALFKRGWNQPGDMENRYSELLGTLMDD